MPGDRTIYNIKKRYNFLIKREMQEGNTVITNRMEEYKFIKDIINKL